MLITAATGSTGHVLAVAIVFIVTHFADANVILPHIVGGKMKMNPFITILAVLIGHLVWGIPGMFLFIPLTAMIRLIRILLIPLQRKYRRAYNTFRRKW